jgi:4-amino-4-deoxy-L-arabinose transferase-like glycosyltransferase
MENPSKPNAAIILQRLLLLIFIIFPVTLAIVAQGISLVHSWNFIKTVQVSLLVAVFLTPVVAVFTNHSFWAAIEKSEKSLVVWIIATAIGVRIILIPLISTDFVSDMRDIHLFAVDIYAGDPFANLDKYRYIPHATYLTMSGYVLSFVYQIFGASTAVAKLFLAFLSVLTTWLIYLVGKEIANTRVGLVGSFLYATLPSLICYTGVLVGDHFAIPLIVLAILIYARLFRPGHNKTIDILIGYALCGTVIGFVDWFRPIGVLLLISLSISLFIQELKKRAFFQMALALSVLAISFFTISKLATAITESIFKIEVFTISQRIGAYLLTGLNPESSGGLTIDDGRIIGETYRDFGADYAGANRYLIETAFARLEDGDLPKLLIEKFDLMWSNHIALFDYALIGSNDQEIVYLMAHFEALLFIVVNLFIVVGAIISFVKGSYPAVLTMQLFMLGFALLMLVMEVQNRYIVIVLPYSVLLGVMGFDDVFSLKGKFLAR